MITPDHTVWVTTYNGTLFGVPSSQPPSSAPFSITSIPTVTFAGNTYPFNPNYSSVAADGNLTFMGSSNNVFYAVEVAY